jgi:hypothetical protein
MREKPARGTSIRRAAAWPLTMYEKQLALAEAPARRANEREIGVIGRLRQFGRMRTWHHALKTPQPILVPFASALRRG